MAYPTTVAVNDPNPISSTVSYNYDLGATTRQQDPKGAAQTTEYDSAGRVKRITSVVNGAYTRFVYGIGGQLLMEFSGTGGSVKREYVYGGGSMVTIAPTAKGSVSVQYLTSDPLGTPRVITKANGTVAARHDYLPFGEEIFAGTGGRTTGMGFNGSACQIFFVDTGTFQQR